MPLISRAYFRHVNPRGMLADFREVWRQAGQHRWRIAAVSAACTFGVFTLMMQQGGKAPHQPQKVTYITVFRPDRTDAEIMASNLDNQKRKEALAKEQAKRDEQVRAIYKTLGRWSGMDVDRIVAEADAEKAAEAKAAAEADARLRAGKPAPVPSPMPPAP